MPATHRSQILILLLLTAATPRLSADDFVATTEFNERLTWSRLDCGVRVLVVAPAPVIGRDHQAATHARTLVVYATPNGNTIEQTLGCALPAAARGTPEPGIEPATQLDWRFDIQHTAAQLRRLREIDEPHEWLLAVVQPTQLSWPAFRREQTAAPMIIRELVATLARQVSAEHVVLSGHSGGGAFLFGYLDSVESLPPWIDRFVFLDANYSYSDSQRHGEKLLEWLQAAADHKLIVIAYDDREIELNGKKVVGPDGGTFRATERMRHRFAQELELTEAIAEPFQRVTGLNNQLQFMVHPNRDSKILHTALVGEMNGLLYGLTAGTPLEGTWGQFGGPRAYSKWIAPRPIIEPPARIVGIARDSAEGRLAIPSRDEKASGGSEFLRQIAELPREQRESAIRNEILLGNVPEFLRRLKPIQVEFKDKVSDTPHTGTYFVMPDYLAVGNDADYFRVPLTPATASEIADRFDASLITTQISEDLFRAAEVRLDPMPLTENRDTAAAFWQHHQIIERQLADRPRGSLVVGIKKDVVLTNRLKEKPHKVAIYGWHYRDGRPIQSLYVGHVDWYVDYSHGIRLMSRQVIVDGKLRGVADVLNDSGRCALLSSEGPMDVVAIRAMAAWGQ